MAKTRKTTKTTTKSVSSKTAPRTTAAAVEVEVVEAQTGSGWEAGAAIVTTLILVAAILLVDYQLGTAFGAGMFFK